MDAPLWVLAFVFAGDDPTGDTVISNPYIEAPIGADRIGIHEGGEAGRQFTLALDKKARHLRLAL
jgi:hypothetical protein